ncbi:hypothetical protein TorRG33x02_295170 [Trema orientale]|uniref:Transmembrane protein n=1 Tax=Trema orientale TaxID=63057 RepID=A0A2P5C6X5_TREOI|nr:hypothetical protein TorRG33x02_295170 [Trema orientale]
MDGHWCSFSLINGILSQMGFWLMFTIHVWNTMIKFEMGLGRRGFLDDDNVSGGGNNGGDEIGDGFMGLN